MCATDDIGNRTGRGVSPAGISSPPPLAGPAERRIVGATGLGLVLLGALSMAAALGAVPGVDLASRAGRIVGAVAGAAMIAGGARLWWRRGRVRTRRLVGLAAYVFFLLLVAEGVLQLAGRLDPRWGFILSELPAATADPVLGHRPSPLHPEHDSNGFRNRTVPESVDFVALGDSQTYGDNADRESAWPQRLSALTGRAIYNMAFGGYSAPQALALMPEALALRPRAIVFALYSGNDLQEAFWTVYLDEVQTGLASADPTLVGSLLALEREQPSSYAARPAGGSGNVFKLPGLARAGLRVLTAVFDDPSQYWDRYVRQAAARDEFVFDVPGYRTIFTARTRLDALRLADPRIQEGYRLTLEAILRMHAMAAERDIAFLVAMIPTKELVFADAVSMLEPATVPTEYRQLLEAEREFRDRLRMDLASAGIPTIDTLASLRATLQPGSQTYSINNNGHPQADGYRAIAAAVAAALRDAGLAL